MQIVFRQIGMNRHSSRKVFAMYLFFPPCKKHQDVDENTNDYVDDDSTNHDDQALPCRLRAKLPGLCRLCHLLFVHRLIDHAGDFHEAAQRKPSNSPFCIADLLLEERKPRVEKEIKLLYTYFEVACRKIMSKLMKDNQYRERQEQLCRFNPKIHRVNNKDVGKYTELNADFMLFGLIDVNVIVLCKVGDDCFFY